MDTYMDMDMLNRNMHMDSISNCGMGMVIAKVMMMTMMTMLKGNNCASSSSMSCDVKSECICVLHSICIWY